MLRSPSVTLFLASSSLETQHLPVGFPSTWYILFPSLVLLTNKLACASPSTPSCVSVQTSFSEAIYRPSTFLAVTARFSVPQPLSLRRQMEASLLHFQVASPTLSAFQAKYLDLFLSRLTFSFCARTPPALPLLHRHPQSSNGRQPVHYSIFACLG